MNVLLTGGAGFIGTHMAAKLLENNLSFIVVDNLSNSNRSQLKKLEDHFLKKIPFYNFDIRDKNKMTIVFDENQIDSVIHFAGLKSVNESVNNPQLYYNNNVVGSINLLNLVKENNIKKFIFSSSATVYGEPKYLPIDEEHPLSAMSPYGQNKIDIEKSIFSDSFFKKNCSTTILRYFNPVGAFQDGLIGEIPMGIPNNLMPYLLGVINGDYPFLQVFGNDYKTTDGTPVRDYIHIMDLIDAHYQALQDNKLGIEVFNIGTGEGYSVMQMIKAFEQINEIKIPYKIMPRREGDVETCFADNKKILKRLNWKSTRDIYQICKDAYKFSQNY
ncbi:UDP-glucose 4-epimerase GalE [Methylophilaceae bacterium]|nr:UDP-glucose 4-epimerase GalE [Methylophilaceae bacterium]